MLAVLIRPRQGDVISCSDQLKSQALQCPQHAIPRRVDWKLGHQPASTVSARKTSCTGSSLAAGAADPGGVATRLLLGIKTALAV